MNFRIRLVRDDAQGDENFEVFTFCLYTIRKPRLVPSIYRHPHLSVRWLWITVTLSVWNVLEPLEWKPNA